MDSDREPLLPAGAAPSDRPEPEVGSAASQRAGMIFARLASASIARDVQERALAEPAGTPSFARGLWRIAAADASSGNRVALLRNGPATFAAMLELIESAERSVCLEGYIFRDDEVGQQFADALIAAAKRGVEVRLLIDWIGRMGTPRSFFNTMRSGGVEVQIFNPPGFRRWLGLVPRDHRKLLVVDNRAGVTGGIGIGREWKTGVLKRRRAPWRDSRGAA